MERTTVEIAAGTDADPVALRATGQVVRFDGFLTLYQEGRDDDSDDEEGGRLPPMNAGRPADRARHRRPTSISPSRRRATPRRR